MRCGAISETLEPPVTCCLSVSFPVYACKLSDREHPLYLRLVAGPRTDTLSFVLREHEIGEVGEKLFVAAALNTEQPACFMASRRWGPGKGGEFESPRVNSELA